MECSCKMATRTTRSRSRQQSVEQDVQSKITDSFRVTRRGTTMPGKLIKEEGMDTISEYSAPSFKESYVAPVPPANDFVTPTPAVTKVTKKALTKTTKKIKQEVVLPTEKVVVEAAVPPALDSPPRRARKTPTPTNSPQAPKSSVRRLVFNDEIEPKEEQPSQPIEIASSSHEAPITPPFGIKEKKAEDKIRSSAALQARIAEKSAAMKRLHAQNAVSKIRQVEEVANVLKSPKKALHISPIKKPSHSSPVKRLAPLFTTPSKRPEAIKINNPDGSASKVPGYVLPSHKTPAKEVDSDEEREQEQRRQQLEMGKSALLHDFVKKNINVQLPEKYQTLIDKFHCCDRIVSIFSGRGSRCEANEIFKNVSNNLRKDFNKTHLAQIMAVYPKSYNLRLEEQRNVSGKPIGRFDLVLDPNVNDDLTEFMRPESPVKQRMDDEPMPLVLPGRCLSPQKSPRKKVAPIVAREAVLDMRPRLEGWRMTSRKYVMHHLLAERVKLFHKKFMEKMGEKIREIRRFHPLFLAKMDRECEDIEQGELPLPDKKEDNFKDVRQFMNSVDEPVTAVDVAIKELSGKGDISETRNIPLSPKKFAQLAASKPVGAKSLLERIREKEAQKKAAEAARDPVAERRHFLLELLQTKVLRSVLNVFVQKNCRSMELALVVEKLEYSTKRTKSELKECLELMCDVAAEVSKVVEVANRKYLQIEKDKHDVVRSSLKTALEKTPAPAFPFAAKAR